MSSTPTVPALKIMVATILDENPMYVGVQARNSDIALTILIWQRWYDVADSIMVGRLFNLPREDNVKRVRAVLQNVEHKYLPTDPAILIKRGIEEAYWFDALGYNLTADEWRIHHKTVKETTPPQFPAEGSTVGLKGYGHADGEYVATGKSRALPDGGIALTLTPRVPTENEMLVAGETAMKPYTPNPDAPTPVTYTTKLQAIYLPKSYSSSSLQTGEQYEIEIEQLVTGQPIKMVAPFEAVYPNLQSFGKTWKVLR